MSELDKIEFMVEVPAERVRRLPQQSRSQQRVAQILAAAAQVFAEVGYEAASTTMIAERGKTSVGSLYRFSQIRQRFFKH
ncbi:MAG: helix-turn-helix transcriptional regulator [Leptolyngbyaceae cyanobacterium SM1_3_5]|nr:helix-turn-helix transcriptional regulator [Leptolyngbyaceae cyanobacterium SM1_3_5]